MKVRLSLLLALMVIVEQSSCMQKSIFSWRNVGAVTAASIGVGSLAWQVYHKDSSLSKSLFTGACFLGSFLFYAFPQRKRLTHFPKRNAYKRKPKQKDIPQRNTGKENDNNYHQSGMENKNNNNVDLERTLQGSLVSVVNDLDFVNKVNAYMLQGDVGPLKELVRTGELSLTELVYGDSLLMMIANKQDWDKWTDIFTDPKAQEIYGRNSAINLFLATYDVDTLKAVAFDDENKEFLKIFLDHFLEVRNEQGETPLQTAIRLGRATNAIYLLNQGANPFVVTQEGETVLTLAKQSPYYYNYDKLIECIKVAVMYKVKCKSVLLHLEPDQNSQNCWEFLNRDVIENIFSFW